MRPSKDQWAMDLALATSKRATCLRRQCGCVLLNARGHVLATGYNGVAAGQAHCSEVSVNGYVAEGAPSQYSVEDLTTRMLINSPHVKKTELGKVWLEPYSVKDTVLKFEWFQHACPGANAPSGQGLDACQAIHAEQNALLQCRDVYAIHTAYVTASPCITCCKLLLNTSCERIVFLTPYPHPEAKALWEGAGREWSRLN